MTSRPVGFDMNPNEDSSLRLDTSTSSSRGFLKSKKLRSIFNKRTLIVVLLILGNFILAYLVTSLQKSVTEALATNRASEEQASQALERAIRDVQNEIIHSKLEYRTSSGKQKTQLEYLSREVVNSNPNTKTPATPTCPYMNFLEVATKHGTDKVIQSHVYDRLYGPYMEPVRCDKIKIMEIGLGCDMPYGPGKSFNLWLEFFPNAEIYFIEYDKKCADKWNGKNPRIKIFSGDQADRVFLRSVIEQTGGNFDFIIDDGGHHMDQQKTSLEEFVFGLRPGGVYFLEDLLTSFMPRWGGHGDSDPNTTVNYIKGMMSDLMSRRARLAPNVLPLTNEIVRIDCVDEMCAFTRRKEDQQTVFTR